MKSPSWRSYQVSEFFFQGLQLCEDGDVELAGQSYWQGQAIDVSFGLGNRIVRPPGFGEFLVIRRPDGIPLLFTYDNGSWHRWVRLYRVGQWRFWLRDLIRTWGVGAPMILAAYGVYAWTIIRGLYLLLATKTLIALGIIVALLLLWNRWHLSRIRKSQAVEKLQP